MFKNLKFPFIILKKKVFFTENYGIVNFPIEDHG